MQESELIIKREVEEMILWANRPLQQFLRSERHVLAADIRKTMYELLRLIIVANHRYHKKTTLQDIDVSLDILRSQVRISKDLNYLSFRDYESWAKRMVSIGCLIGGWIKWAESKRV